MGTNKAQHIPKRRKEGNAKIEVKLLPAVAQGVFAGCRVEGSVFLGFAGIMCRFFKWFSDIFQTYAKAGNAEVE